MNAGPAEEPLWVLTGPTASGKTALGLELAERLARTGAGAEILSMDSMAVYKRMDVGTSKPTAADRERVPHHLIDLVEPWEPFDTSRWCEAAAAAVASVRARGARPLLVGGTPLYLLAFGKGLMPGPAADPLLRAALARREHESPGSLHDELSRRDPQAAARIHRHDHKRLVRALEVLERTGKPISEQQDSFAAPGWLRRCRIVAVRRPREELHARVRERTIAMLRAGLLDEARAIVTAGGFAPQAAGAIGYAECLQFLAGRCKDEEELRNRIRRSTHRLIRRQTTWLRHIAGVTWIDAAAAGAERLEAEFASRGGVA
jgi:tRNA dimethylallyltransferase